MIGDGFVRRAPGARLWWLFVLALAVVATRARAQQPAAPSATPAATAPAAAPSTSATPAPAQSATPAPATSAPPAPPTPPPPPTKEQLAEAKKFFDAGLKLAKQGLYQEALASFVEANRIVPRESIQRNIGEMHRNLKDFAAAYDDYELLLKNYGDKMKPSLKDAAGKALEELAVLTGVAVVTVQEPDAKITITARRSARRRPRSRIG